MSIDKITAVQTAKISILKNSYCKIIIVPAKKNVTLKIPCRADKTQRLGKTDKGGHQRKKNSSISQSIQLCLSG